MTLKLSGSEEERAQELHQKSIIIDGLISGERIVYAFPNRPPNDVRLFELMRKGGVTGANMTVIKYEQIDDFRIAMEGTYKWYGVVEREQDLIMNALTAEDIEHAKSLGKMALMTGFQNATCIERDLGRLALFQRLGVRIIQLTYNWRNLLGDGCTERTNCGLSVIGVKVVEEMNRLGLVVDLSHCGDQTTMDAIEISKDPVIITHSNARSLCAHEYGRSRTKTDEQIKAMAEKGGVIGLTMFSTILEAKKGVRPTIDDYLNQVDYIANLVGPDHVGIGSDHGQPPTPKQFEEQRLRHPLLYKGYTREAIQCAGLESPADLPNLTRGLVARGYSDMEVQKILGESFLRVFKAVMGK